MNEKDDWDYLLLTQKTKAFKPVNQVNKHSKKRKNTPGTIIMAFIAILSISTAIVFTAILIVKKIELSKLENQFISVNEPYNALVEEKAQATSELEKIKIEIDNLQKQIDSMRG